MSLTSVIRYARALDTAASDGSGKTGLAFGDITAKYLTQGGTLTALTPETIATLGTYQAPTDATHIRIKELAGSNPTEGIYELHFHNTQVLSTGQRLWLFLSATGASFTPLELNLIVPPTATENATAWGARVLGNSRTADMFIQGLTNKYVFAADGLSWTLYGTDDATPLATGTSVRLDGTIAGLRTVDPA